MHEKLIRRLGHPGYDARETFFLESYLIIEVPRLVCTSPGTLVVTDANCDH